MKFYLFLQTGVNICVNFNMKVESTNIFLMFSKQSYLTFLHTPSKVDNPSILFAIVLFHY